MSFSVLESNRNSKHYVLWGFLQAPTQSNCMNVVVLPALHTPKGQTSPVLDTSLPYFGSFKVRSHHPCCIQLFLTLGTISWRKCPTKDISKDIPKWSQNWCQPGVSCDSYKPFFCIWVKYGKPCFPSDSWQHLRWANSPSWGWVSEPLASVHTIPCEFRGNVAKEYDNHIANLKCWNYSQTRSD